VCRVVRFLYDGQHQRLSRIESLHLPQTSGATASSRGRSSHTESGHIGTGQIKMLSKQLTEISHFLLLWSAFSNEVLLWRKLNVSKLCKYHKPVPLKVVVHGLVPMRELVIAGVTNDFRPPVFVTPLFTRTEQNSPGKRCIARPVVRPPY